MTPPPDSSCSNCPVIALVAELRAELAALRVRIAELEKENAELRAKLGMPPKTPANSSIPPSLGRKASGTEAARPKGKGKRKSHPGAHRALHPNPTHKVVVTAECCEHCQANVSKETQTARQTYDHIEIPPIKPIITQITVMEGVCPCCGKPFPPCQ